MGKTREQQTKIDKNLAGASRRTLDRMEQAQAIPFMPNRGPTIAGFTPKQTNAFGMQNNALNAFGFDNAGPYIPPEGETVGGIFGHSPATWYDSAKEASVPLGLQQYIDQFFVDPQTGLPAAGSAGETAVTNGTGYTKSVGDSLGTDQGGHLAPEAPAYYSDPYSEEASANAVGGVTDAIGRAAKDAFENSLMGRGIAAISGNDGSEGTGGGK